MRLRDTYKRKQLIDIIAEEDIYNFKEFLALLCNEEQKFFLRNDIIQLFKGFCIASKKTEEFMENSSIALFLRRVQELFVRDDHITLMYRYAIAKYHFYIIRIDGEVIEEIGSSEYIDLKDYYILGEQRSSKHLHIDYMPFYDYSPSIKDAKTIGNGIRYLNRFLSSNIFSRSEEWNAKLFNFIKLHKHNGQQLLVNDSILTEFDQFYNGIQSAIDWLGKELPDASFSLVEKRMKESGFESGWGNTVDRILGTMQLLIDLLNEPTDILLEQFLSRVPMPLISKIAIISPHGWFGQENVLGRPDTGGQVIYILDQVRALEKQLKQEIELAGLNIIPAIVVLTRFIPDAEDTTCNLRKEMIHETDNCWILRVPFKDKDHNIVNHWIPRFKIWPYLEQFAEDSTLQLISELRGRPDLVIGNYSDGNLVSSLISEKLDITQCTIAHALEKTKYLFSDLYWNDYEDDYHFSIQFAADIISMNRSDFIISSTYQEIAGTQESMGQYESYQFFTMPGLCQVENGINLFDPKFNIIPPGVDEKLYFPYYLNEKRVENKTSIWKQRILLENSKDIYGELKDPEKTPIFTMARLDRIKNITGLIEAYGISETLKENCNLIFAAGTIHFEESKDIEEQKEIRNAYHLIDKYDLYNSVRWLPSINKIDTGEVYRIIADLRGIFVQPALFEAFGLTILEAMLSGLPTFGPMFGGPLEIIEDGTSGFLLNTSSPQLIAEGLEDFINRYLNDRSLWDFISENGIKRVKEHFTWELYSERLLNLAKIYGFWRYSVSGKEKVKMHRYNDLIYNFIYKERAESL
ncbi:MAG: sucrose synthase [Spirochaetota bacterium]|nr:sucrose synthase [Spirochaetota bacterium]